MLVRFASVRVLGGPKGFPEKFSRRFLRTPVDTNSVLKTLMNKTTMADPKTASAINRPKPRTIRGRNALSPVGHPNAHHPKDVDRIRSEQTSS